MVLMKCFYATVSLQGRNQTHAVLLPGCAHSKLIQLGQDVFKEIKGCTQFGLQPTMLFRQTHTYIHTHYKYTH